MRPIVLTLLCLLGAMGACAKSVPYDNPGGVPKMAALGRPIPTDPCAETPNPMLGLPQSPPEAGGWKRAEQPMCGGSRIGWTCEGSCAPIVVQWSANGTDAMAADTIRAAVNVAEGCNAEFSAYAAAWFGIGGDPNRVPQVLAYKAPTRWVKEITVDKSSGNRSYELRVKPTAGCKVAGLGFVP